MATKNKTTQNDADVETFIARIPDGQKRDDRMRLVELMSAVTGEPPQVWGPSIIGFGSYHYRYESGREGDSCVIGFSPRAQNLSLYLTLTHEGSSEVNQPLLDRLGKHKLGKGCLYI